MKGAFIFISIFFCISTMTWAASGPESKALTAAVKQSYELIQYPQKPDFEVYRKAVVGYLNLRKTGKIKKDLLVLADFSLSSNEKRLWVINMVSNEVVYHDLVAHGRNSGNEFAEAFSNTPDSNMSSLGFYVTAENYYGKHGLSLRLDGMEKGINHNARRRAIVMHGADYVSDSFTKKYGRIGRSFGCPSVPMAGHEELLQLIAEGACLFIYFPDRQYQSQSVLQDEMIAYSERTVLQQGEG